MYKTKLINTIFLLFAFMESIYYSIIKMKNMKRISILSVMALVAILFSSCAKTCVCTSRSQNTDGTIWEWETRFKVVGGTSCVENAGNTAVTTLVDNEGNRYKSYECREE